VTGATLERRLANYRTAIRPDPAPSVADKTRSAGLAQLLATAVDGEVVDGAFGAVVRCEPLTVVLPLDRDRLACLPGQPPPDVPLVCLDTETTGLATAAGTMAFLVGLGWWEGERFRQAQLLLPDQPNELALLMLIEAHIPRTSWLVTYNGRGFDWPLLVTRYRMARRDPPVHAGHLDLLPFVRRVFRHRMADARLRTVETDLLNVARHEDVEGWQIPGRYLDFLRLGIVEPLIAVVRHNREDVRSLARLLGHIEKGFADVDVRRTAARGDLAGLARAFSRERRFAEALDCLETALAAPIDPPPTAPSSPSHRSEEDRWWMPRHRADFGGPPPPPPQPIASAGLDAPWTEERILIDRARLLRRLGRFHESASAWEGLAAGSGPVAAHAWVEVSKLREHRLGDHPGALEAGLRARAVIERRRRLALVDPALERGLARRLERLTRRVAAAAASAGRRPAAQSVAVARAGTSGSLGSTGIEAHVDLTQSRSGSNEQAIVRRSPARALR
jgi:RNase H-like protein